MGRLAKNPRIDAGALTVQIPSVTTEQRPDGANGDLIYNSTTSTFQAYTAGLGWANISTGNSALGTVTFDKFQGDGTTTVFGNGLGNMDDSTAAQLSFTVIDESDILVFVGGVFQIPVENYTVQGNTITFGSAPPADDGQSNDHMITIIHGLNRLGE